MEIFEVSGSVVRPTAGILTIKPFKEIWETKGKEIAMQEFAYIEFMVSQKKNNPYKGYDESIKPKKITEGVIVIEDWQPCELVLEAIEWYEEWQTTASPSYQYYKANLNALRKTIRYLNHELNYSERNNAGMPVHKFNDVIRGIKDADQVLKSMNSLKVKVEEELYEASKTKGNKEINPYER